MIYIPTQTRFPIRVERVTCHGSKLTNSLGKQRYSHMIKSYTFETASNLNESRIKQIPLAQMAAKRSQTRTEEIKQLVRE